MEDDGELRVRSLLLGERSGFNCNALRYRPVMDDYLP